MYVCVCHAVKGSHMKAALNAGKQSVRELRQHLGVTSSCGKCTSCMRSMLNAHLQSGAGGGESGM